jgi:predicted helicase
MADSTPDAKRARIFYARVDEFARKEDKYKFLDDAGSMSGVEWQELQPDAKHTWLTEGMRDEFESFLPMGTMEAKASKSQDVESIFKIFSNGVKTNHDRWAYNFNKDALATNMKQMIDIYNEQVSKWHRQKVILRVLITL